VIKFDPLSYHYASRRNVVYAEKGMVATSHPLAAQAGLDILKQGGNAIDAAIATAACLTVVEPTANGLGGDAFALVWSGDKLHGLNASGPAPMGITAEVLRDKGHTEMPIYGLDPVTIPGLPAGWATLSEKFGRLEFSKLLEPAIHYAEQGFPIAVTVAKAWEEIFALYKQKLTDPIFNHWFETFAPKGRAPRAGELFANLNLGKTLRSVAATKSESFYNGELAQAIVAFSQKNGGYHTLEDFAHYQPEWVEPISVNYRGYDVYEIPPNGHGITVLMALNILKGFSFESTRETPETYHKMIEAVKLAFCDAKEYVTDADCMSVSVGDMLSEAYAAERRALISETALEPVPGKPTKGGTVYLATADGEGNMVSFIQSNYMGFGSAVVVPETGIALHNRGNNFNLTEGHDNCLAPGKKPYHTIIPGFLGKGGKAIGPFGVMGGFMQPQGHVQMVTNTIDFHLNPQDSLDAPRWQWTGGKTIEIEGEMDRSIVKDLIRRGHDVKLHYNHEIMGRGQIIWRNEDGVLCGGSEPRTDGTIASW